MDVQLPENTADIGFRSPASRLTLVCSLVEWGHSRCTFGTHRREQLIDGELLKQGARGEVSGGTIRWFQEGSEMVPSLFLLFLSLFWGSFFFFFVYFRVLFLWAKIISEPSTACQEAVSTCGNTWMNVKGVWGGVNGAWNVTRSRNMILGDSEYFFRCGRSTPSTDSGGGMGGQEKRRSWRNEQKDDQKRFYGVFGPP